MERISMIQFTLTMVAIYALANGGRVINVAWLLEKMGV